MRIYQTKTIPATIRQKTDPSTKFKPKGHQLTAEDFEIVPEHEAEYLAACYCDFCGKPAAWVHSEEEVCSLIRLEFWHHPTIDDDQDDCTDVFCDDWSPELCEHCVRSILAPYLQSLRRLSPVPVSLDEPSVEVGILSDAEALGIRASMAHGLLIGDDEDGRTLPLPKDDEPF